MEILIKKENMLKALKCGLIGLVLTGAVAAPLCPAFALIENQEKKEAKTEIEHNTQDQVADKRKQILEEAVGAVTKTRAALKALDEGKTEDALTDLETATGKLEVILARDPSLQLAPTGVSATTSDIYATPSDVKTAIDKSRDYLDKGRIQDARHLLEHMASETVISVTNIPLVAYPEAIKGAVKLIDERKNTEAKELLQTALNNMVVTETIVPLPVVRARHLLEEAEKLANNAKRTREENEHLTDLISLSQDNIAMGAALGYGTPSDFKDFNDQIDEIRKKTEGGKSGAGFFEKIKTAMHSMIDYSQSGKEQSGKTQENK